MGWPGIGVGALWAADINVTVSPQPITAYEDEVEISIDVKADGASGVDGVCGALTVTDVYQGTRRSLPNVGSGCPKFFYTHFMPAGPHQLEVAFSGNDEIAPVTKVVDLAVLRDPAVRASGVGVTVSTFYPYKDGYRDTVAIRGEREEPASVSVRIYDGSNRLVRSLSKTRADGGYALNWDGRKTAGTRAAAGRYRVVQTLQDTAGNKKTYTSYVNVSNKRLRWYTSSATKSGEGFNWSDHTALGSVSRSQSRYASGVRLGRP